MYVYIYIHILTHRYRNIVVTVVDLVVLNGDVPFCWYVDRRVVFKAIKI